VAEVTVPDIGDFTDVPVIEILVKPGDVVAEEDPLITLESDKATMEVPSPFAGVVEELRVKLGDQVSEGSPILTLLPAEGETGPAVADAPEATAAPVSPAEPVPAPPPAVKPEPAASGDGAPSGDGAAVYASPSVRRLAREQGVDLTRVQGTGRKGRITPQDVEAATAAPPAAVPAPAAPPGAPVGLRMAPWPSLDFSRYGEVERVPRTRIQKISAPNLVRNWVMIPHVTHHEEADITDLEAFRKQINAEHPETKVTMVALLLKAVVASLKEYPDVNSSLSEDWEELIRKRYYHLGFAADTPQGLVVPVIKDVDKKGLLEIAEELRALSAKARDGKLGPADITGSTFTISSLGGIGGTGFTPIVNAPEVAILGVTRSAMKPVWDGSAFVPRLIVPLSLSYDHRVIDGAAAARFMVHLSGVLSDMRRVLL
jgi:pyruvate dehydrogenase E2 component (dihydrolipoyllysine-residue acetyltransferase)